MKIGLWALFAGLLAVGVVLAMPTIKAWIDDKDADDTPEAEKFLSTDVPTGTQGGSDGLDPLTGEAKTGQDGSMVPGGGQNPQAMPGGGMNSGGQMGSSGYPQLPAPMTGGPAMQQGGNQMSGPPAGYAGFYYAPGKNSDSDIMSQNYQQGSKYAMSQSQPAYGNNQYSNNQYSNNQYGSNQYGKNYSAGNYAKPKQKKIQLLQSKINKLKYELQGLEGQLQQAYQSSQKPVSPQPYGGYQSQNQNSTIVCDGDGTTLGGTCQPQGTSPQQMYGQPTYQKKPGKYMKKTVKNYAALKSEVQKLRYRVKQLEGRVSVLEKSP